MQRILIVLALLSGLAAAGWSRPAAAAELDGPPLSAAPRPAPPPAALPLPPSRSPSPESVEKDAETYARCMRLARTDPAAAESLAETWHDRGGAHPAEHCIAVALIGLKQYKTGATKLEALGQAMVHAPASLRADVLDEAGQAWLLAGDPVRAYATETAALNLRPEDPDLLVDRAEAAGMAGYFDKAVADLDRVLKQSPNRADALIYRASAYRALNKLDPALVDIDKALKVEPDSVPALLERGNLRRLKGDLDGARQDWVRVGMLAPGSAADTAAKDNIEHLDGNDTAAPPVKAGAGH